MQTPSLVLHVGADISKNEIAVACDEARCSPRKIGNQRAAVLSFLKEFPAGSRIGVECYHELLATLAHKRGLIVYVLNPKDTHHYAKAMGLRGKTDRVDAQLITRMIAHEHAKLHPWIPPTPEQRQIGGSVTGLAERRQGVDYGPVTLMAYDMEYELSCAM